MKDLAETVTSRFREIFSHEPDWRLRVPGRLEVFGKHTDYAGGRSLVAAVPRGFVTTAHAASDHMVDVVDVMSGARFSCPLGGAEGRTRTTAGWHRYVVTVVRRLERNFPSADFSCRIAIGSDLPPAAGISSSSALVVSLAEILIARGGVEESGAWKAAIRSVDDRAGYFGCIENGSAFGPLEGDAGVGTHGGSEDHAAILMGRQGALLQFSFSPLRLQRTVEMPGGWTFVVLSSGIRASKAAGARADYNRLAAEAAELRDTWHRDHADDVRTLAELARAGVLDGLDLTPRLAERLAHLEAEDARVAEAADAFERGDIGRVGELAADSQRDAERWLQNQVPQTSDLVMIARDIGAAAASAFGAGWGGSVWALVKTAEAQAFLNTWIAAYEAKHPRCRAKGFVSYPANGLQPL